MKLVVEEIELLPPPEKHVILSTVATHRCRVLGCNEALDLTKEGSRGHPQASEQWKQMGEVEKTASVQAEINRMQQLPAVSTYAMHRIRVLSKVLQLLTTKPQEKCRFEAGFLRRTILIIGSSFLISSGL
eukprot:Gb_14331 [translate_table: standard]